VKANLKAVSAVRQTLSVLLLILATPAFADFTCSGILDSSQVAGFNALFTPVFPGGSLSYLPDGTTQVKALSIDEYNTLINTSQDALVKQVLTEQQASDLKSWLVADGNSDIPGWLSTGVGLGSGLVDLAGWPTLLVDLAAQGINSISAQQRNTALQVSGTVSAGGVVGVLQTVKVNANGEPSSSKYAWAYVYKAMLNNYIVVSILYACEADIKIEPTILGTQLKK